jgi:chemotaxis signal transduction protein
MNSTTRFVTFPLGGERYALNSSQVKELLVPNRIYSFPHTMQAVEGVVVRRGTVIPVCDLGAAFGAPKSRSVYVVAECSYGGNQQTVAIPVEGACEIVQGELGEAPEEVTFVSGLLHTPNGTVPLLDLDRVVALCVQPSQEMAMETGR